jgi:hypothetical protein
LIFKKKSGHFMYLLSGETPPPNPIFPDHSKDKRFPILKNLRNQVVYPYIQSCIAVPSQENIYCISAP